jgi:hypothetical protein
MRFHDNRLFIIIALVCFALAVLTTAGVITISKIDWTDLGLFFGFLALWPETLFKV